MGMAEYIEREKLLRDINHYHLSDGKFQHWVEVQPTADVAPVVHGWWIEREFLMQDPYYTCSACGEDICMEETGDPALDLFTYTYCPHCGAKMDERPIMERMSDNA